MSTLSVTDIELAGGLEGAADETPPVFKDLAGSREIVQGVWTWVNFNGTGTVAISDSFNTSSITDNGTGNYTINFTTALPNATYAGVGMAHDIGNITSVNYRTGGTKSTGAFQVSSTVDGGILTDNSVMMVAILCNP